MHKFALAVLAAALAAPASASAATWLVTEENIAGVKGAQGSWTVKTEGANIAGAAAMQGGNGDNLTYKVEGTVDAGVYTIKITDRSDGKKNCVWTGHAPASGSSQSRGLLGYAECEGARLIIRASIVE